MQPSDGWYDVREVGPDSYAIWELDSYVAYLVEGTERAVLVDTGVGVGDLRGLVEELTDRPVTVLLTHTHWDHIGNAAQFDDVRAHPKECAPDGSVAVDGLSDEFVHRPEQALAGWREDGVSFPDGFDPEDYRIDPVESVDPAYAGELLDLGDRHLELVALPGHTHGQLGVLDRERGVLYGADVVGSDYTLLALFEHSDLAQVRASARRTYDLYAAGAFDTLATGHLPPLTSDDLDVFVAIADGVGDVLAGRASSEPAETSYGPAREFAFPEFTVVTR